MGFKRQKAGFAAAPAWRRSVWTVMTMALSIQSQTPVTASASELRGTKPNIIFILADDLGYGDLGCYGQQQIKTPNLDRLASKGIRFTSCYSGSTVCAPARCTLMTGLHTGHCTVRGNKLVPLRAEEVTVAEVLKDAGYVTGIFGKWGLGEPETDGLPNRQGFDEWFGYLNQKHAHNYYPEYLWKNETKVSLPNKEAGGVATRKEQYSHTLIMEQALDFITRHRDDRFFLYLAVTLPHANNEAGGKLGDGMEVPDYGIYRDRDWPNPEKGRAAMVSLLDRDVGRVVALTEELGIAGETLIIFTSDNGPHNEGGSKADFFDSNGPLKGTKRDLYEGGIRVPGIGYWPGKIKPGTASDEPWAFWDFLPTAAALANADTISETDGISILPALVGESLPRKEPLYWEFHERGFDQACRDGKWKVVRHNRGPVELYNLSQDIGETENIADAYPEKTAELEHYLDSARTESADFPVNRTGKKKPSTKRKTP